MTVLEAQPTPPLVAKLPSNPPAFPEGAGMECEWLETDGRGGYAASTPALCPTRRYHGLLVSPFAGTAKRHVFLSRFEEVLAGESFSLAQYGESFAPRGNSKLEAFELAPHPKATYATSAGRITREVRMVPGERTVLVRYELIEAPAPALLELRPLLPFREADALTIENDVARDATEVLGEDGQAFAWQLYPALPRLVLTSSRALELAPDPVWYHGITFAADEARGYEGTSDELSPAFLRITLKPGQALMLAAMIEETPADPAALWKQATKKPSKRKAAEDSVEARLERAAQNFLYRDDNGRAGVIAGYPWFGEWGRDTFLALPGLTLARGKRKECEEVLLGALPYLKDGLLPNIFGTSTEDSHYGSADAALWFARAVLLFDRAGGAKRVLDKQLIPALESIAHAYIAGTDLGLRFDEDGILHAGTPELNPTWMDARVAKGPVTPRHGAPVEIVALGYSLLAQLDERSKGPWSALCKQAKRAFLQRFWLPEEQYLADLWRDGVQDKAVRPNMVLAAALELSPLNKSQRAAIVARAQAELLTPVGLRTLSPQDPAYIGVYAGNPEERDTAYHQGTVWPWLLGFYTEASLRAARPTQKRRDELAELWDGFVPELDRIGQGHISEVFNGDAPHEPGGTFAQAWNTAEWLRARQLLSEGQSE